MLVTLNSDEVCKARGFCSRDVRCAILISQIAVQSTAYTLLPLSTDTSATNIQARLSTDSDTVN